MQRTDLFLHRFLSLTILALLISGVSSGATRAKRRQHRRVVAPTTAVRRARVVRAVATRRAPVRTAVARVSRNGAFAGAVIAGGPWTEPTYADSTFGDVVDGEDPVIRRAAVEALGSYNGSVVVVDPTDGRILTMVNQKLALGSGFQPCSTIKVSVALAGLSEKVIQPDNKFRLAGLGRIDLTYALAHSNNYYFATLGEKLGFEKVSYYAHLFGYGEKAGLNIQGEQPGRFPSAPPRNGGVGMLTSFGEEISQVQALRSLHTDEALDALLASTKQSDARVRREVADAIGGFYADKAFAAEREMLREEKNPDILAAVLRDFGGYAKPGAREELLKFLDSQSYRNELAGAAISGLRLQDDPSGIAPLLATLTRTETNFTSHGFAQGLTALAYLARNEEKKDKVRDFLVAHVNDKRRTVQLASLNALGTLGDPAALGVLERFATASKSSPEQAAAERAVASLRAARKPVDDFKNLRQEVLDLQKENRDLRKDVDDLTKKSEASRPAAAATSTRPPAAPVPPAKPTSPSPKPRVQSPKAES